MVIQPGDWRDLFGCPEGGRPLPGLAGESGKGAGAALKGWGNERRGAGITFVR
jgi:hypothetical protein